MIGSVEADPEYQLIVDSNNLIVEIDNEISKYIGGDVKPSVPRGPGLIRVWLHSGDKPRGATNKIIIDSP